MEVPQVRDSQEPFRSQIQKFFKNNTDVLEKLSTEMYARGLSTRGIEDALYTATGDRLLSKSSVSRVTEILWKEYEWFISRDLTFHKFLYSKENRWSNFVINPS
ncbi:MAG: transposase [Candidatus Omnitrophica bacterium]|nr:transposase [Candidatus Omnitrophota bacterium]